MKASDGITLADAGFNPLDPVTAKAINLGITSVSQLDPNGDGLVSGTILVNKSNNVVLAGINNVTLDQLSGRFITA